MKAFVSDLILYNCPLPHWYGNFAAAVYSLANRIYGGRSIDTALILDDIRMIRSDGDLPEAMQSIPDGESGDYSIASYPARDLARLLLEVDASTWDDGVDGCCGFTTFSPTDPSASRQTSSITDFLMALASYGYSNVDVPLVPLLQITTLVDRSLQDVSSCDTGTESLTDAMLTATLCAYYSSFDHRFQAIYFPDVRAKYESQDCAQFFDLSSFIAVKMSDDTELTIDAFWNAVNGSAEKKNIWSTFVETFDTDKVSFDQSIMMTRLIGTPKRAEKRRMVLRVNQYMTLGIEHDADDKQAMSFGEVVDESWRKSLRMYVDSVINDTSMLPFQLQRTSIPTPSAEMQILVMESIGGVYPQPASLETVVSTCIMYLSRESKANDGDEEYQGFLYGIRKAFTALCDMCRKKLLSLDDVPAGFDVSVKRHGEHVVKSTDVQHMLSCMLAYYSADEVLKVLPDRVTSSMPDAVSERAKPDADASDGKAETASNDAAKGAATWAGSTRKQFVSSFRRPNDAFIYLPQSCVQMLSLIDASSEYASKHVKRGGSSALGKRSVLNGVDSEDVAREETTYGRFAYDYVRLACALMSGHETVTLDDFIRTFESIPSAMCAPEGDVDGMSICAAKLFEPDGDNPVRRYVDAYQRLIVSKVSKALTNGNMIESADVLAQMPFSGAAITLYARRAGIGAATCTELIEEELRCLDHDFGIDGGSSSSGALKRQSIRMSSVIVRQDGTYRLSDAFIRLVDSIQLRISMNGEAHMITGVSDVNNYKTYYYAAFIAMMVISMSGDDSSFDICDCGRIADFIYPSGDWCLYRMLSYSDGNEQSTSSAQNGKVIDVSVMSENWHPCDASDIADVDGLTDLTVLAETEGLGSNVVARDDEFEQLVSVLIRKDKSNPAIIGSPGVGKTSLVELLARRIVDGDVPQQLQNKRLLAYDLTDVTMGQLGDVRRVVDFATATGTILFVDEFHVVAENQMVKNMIKPQLSRSDLSLIGATTAAEWQASVLPDKALVRRMSPIYMNEMTPAQVIDVLNRRIPSYEAHHGIAYDKMAANIAAIAASTYITGRQSPDRELDVLDTAGSIASMHGHGKVTSDDIYKAVRTLTSNATVMPMTSMLATADDEKMLEDKVRRAFGDIAGQKAAKMTVARRLQVSMLKRSDQPRNVLLFAGPSGVGKTMMASRIPRFLGTSEDAVLTINLSEYVQDHEYARLVGSPPGYIGYKSGGILTNFAMEHPDGVIILDEFEKASRKVQDVLLRAFDEGRIDSAAGESVDCRSITFVCTTNAAFDVEKKPSIGFMTQADDDTVDVSEKRRQISERLGAPMMGRFDEIVFFDELKADDIREICRIRYDELKRSYVRTCGIDLSSLMSDSDVENLVDRHMDGAEISKTGARYVAKAFEQDVNEKVIEYAKRITSVAAQNDEPDDAKSDD